MAEPVQQEVRLLLHALAEATGDAALEGLEAGALARVDGRADLARWADSGAMHLSGRPDGPPAAPGSPVASRLAAAGAVFAELSARRRHSVPVDADVALDAPALLGERAALRSQRDEASHGDEGSRGDAAGLQRQGAISAGGGCRLLPTRDGWVAITLNRPDDWELLPALFVGARSTTFRSAVTDWPGVETAVSATAASELSARAAELGLAIGVLPSGPETADEQQRSRQAGSPWVITAGGQKRHPPDTLQVVDLSALWAGPLCASLLHGAGADVTTVESTSRPDGARRGDPLLHRLLHAGHTMRSIDISGRAGLAALHGLVKDADIVITSARPRALQQLGLDPFAWLDRRPDLTFVAITAYGLTGPWCNRIGYGDDTAVAGGLVIRDPTPMFCADAAADPITGLYAAVAALAVASTGGGVVDVALRDVAAHVARPPACPSGVARRSGDEWVVDVDGDERPVRPPRARAES